MYICILEFQNESQPSLEKVDTNSPVGMPSINIAAVTKDDIPSTSNQPLESIKDAISVATQSDKPVQKNRKRCWTCRVKLELAQRELGVCKCGRYFLVES